MKPHEFSQAIDSIEPSAGYKVRLQAAVTTTKQTPLRFIKLALAACAILAVAFTIMLPVLRNAGTHIPIPQNPNSNTEVPPGSSATREPIPALSDIRGLPASHFIVPNGKAEADRLVYTSLPDFFMYSRNRSFAIVRVLDTQMVSMSEEEGYWWHDWQRAKVEVLYSLNVELPAALDVMQSHMEGNEDLQPILDVRSNLVRKGGVYILPLFRRNDDDRYGVVGDLDCLFEIGDDGLVYSHSQFEGFCKYDNKPLTNLWDDIVYLSEHPALTSGLAMQIRQGVNAWGSVITRGIVTGVAPNTILEDPAVENHHTIITRYTFDILEQLTFLGEDPGTPYMEDYYKEYLTVGSEYILCGGMGVTPYYIARVDENGRVAIPRELYSEGYDDNAFDFADGMTLDELRAAIADICAYYGIDS